MGLWVYIAASFVLFALTEAKNGRISKKSKLVDMLSRRGLAKRDGCNGEGAACTGYAWDKCCDDYVCYWAEGRQLYNLGQEGHCVTCIGSRQQCQFDWQCCEGTVCHTESRHHTNGECGAKRGTGGHCHEDDNCLSGDCDLNWRTAFIDGECT